MTGALNLSASKNKVCKGDSVKLKAIPANGGTLPKYYWYNNAVLLDSNYSDSLMVLPLSTSDYQCKMISNNNCTGTEIVSSNIVNIIVRDSVNTIVNVTPTNPTIINGQSVKFAATLINGGQNPIYQWYLNNLVIPNSNKDTITIFGLKNGDSIYCIIIPDTICLKTPQALSNKIQVNVNNSKIFGQRNNIEYQLFPNPTQGIVEVLLSQEQHGIFQWEILDLSGKKLNSIITINRLSEMEFSFNLGQLKNGMYTMNMKFDGKYYYERIIKIE